MGGAGGGGGIIQVAGPPITPGTSSRDFFYFLFIFFPRDLFSRGLAAKTFAQLLSGFVIISSRWTPRRDWLPASRHVMASVHLEDTSDLRRKHCRWA